MHFHNTYATPFALSLMGATGTGKTQLALAIAKNCMKRDIPVTIINMDSRQVYIDFPIISAQPSNEDQQICPHLLYSYLDSNQKVMAGKYAEEVEQHIIMCNKQNILPILVGGTGLYFKALFSGLAPIPDIEEDIRKKQREKVQDNSQKAYLELQNIDPHYASTIHPNDTQRIARALEVFYQTKKPFSVWHSHTNPRKISTQCYCIDIPLSKLEKVLAQRIDTMLKLGAEEEVKEALKKVDHNTKAPAWSCIGAKEIYGYIMDKTSKDEALHTWRHNTRAYAKRQITWFRAQKAIHFFSEQNEERISEIIMHSIIKQYKN